MWIIILMCEIILIVLLLMKININNIISNVYY